MKSKEQLEKVLKKVSNFLVEHKSIMTPMFCIKSKNPEIPNVVIRLRWHDEETKEAGFVVLHKICSDMEACEVFMVSEIEIYNGEDKNPSSKGISVFLLDYTGVQSVVLPYQMSGDGKITFGKERWMSPEEKDLDFRIVGLVK